MPALNSEGTWTRAFCKRMSKHQAAERFDKGIISKLALITKQKSEDVIKRRIIIDLLRSGGNERARVPERIILPRGTDVVEMMKRLWRLKHKRARETDPLDSIGEAEEYADDPGIEIIGADLSDAYCHFPVAREELGNCLAPGLDEDEIIIFCAMLFGGGTASDGKIVFGLGKIVAVDDNEGRFIATIHGRPIVCGGRPHQSAQRHHSHAVAHGHGHGHQPGLS